MPARRGTRQQQCRDVGARYQQQQRNRSEQDPERLSHSAHRDFLEWLDSGAQAGVGLGILPAQVGLHGGQVGARLFQRHARLQTADCAEPRRLPALRVGRIGAGRPEVHVAIGEEERSRHDADDGAGRPADAEGFADCVAVPAETAAPQAVADEHRIRSAEALFLRSEVAPENRSNSPHLQKTRSHQRPLQFLGKLARKLRFVLCVIAGNRPGRCCSDGSSPQGAGAQQTAPGTWDWIAPASPADRHWEMAKDSAAPRRSPKRPRCWRQCRAPVSEPLWR